MSPVVVHLLFQLLNGFVLFQQLLREGDVLLLRLGYYLSHLFDSLLKVLMLLDLLSAGLVGLFLLLLKFGHVLLLGLFDLSLHLSFHGVHLLAHLLHDLGSVCQLSVSLVNAQNSLLELVLKFFYLALEVFVLVLDVGVLLLDPADLVVDLFLVFDLRLQLVDLLRLVVGELCGHHLRHAAQVLVSDRLSRFLRLLQVSDALERRGDVVLHDLRVEPGE